MTGGLMLAAAFRLHGGHGNLWLGLGGAVSVFRGILLWIAPLIGAVGLTLWLGAYALLFGITMIALALRSRSCHMDAAP